MASPSLGDDFQKGLNAYYIEDFATAVREWTPLAEQGDADARTIWVLCIIMGKVFFRIIKLQ